MLYNDIVDQKTGKTIKQSNLDIKHAIPIGTLVELPSGVRLFVVFHGRDCDGSPLYWLSSDNLDTTQRVKGFANPKWIGAYSEEFLKMVSC